MKCVFHQIFKESTIFYYYGAKNQLAKHYPEPKNSIIIEPFAGSGAFGLYHLKKDSSKTLILIEKDIRVYNTWKYLLGCNKQDIENYPVPKIGDKTSDFLIMTCAVSNAVSKCKNLKYTERLNKVFNIQKNKILRLLEVRNRIEIVNDSYENSPNIRGTWFIDPPYQITELINKNTVFANGDGYSKLCGAKQIDYEFLAKFCKERVGDTIVCEKNGARWLDFQYFKKGKTSLGTNFKEVMWYKNE